MTVVLAYQKGKTASTLSTLPMHRSTIFLLVGALVLSTCLPSSGVSLRIFRSLDSKAILAANAKQDSASPLRLRGGDDTSMADAAAKDLKSWGEDDVIVFVKGLREKLGAKTDEYVAAFRYSAPNSSPLGDA